MFTVVVSPLGGVAVELTPAQESLKFTTAAVGGFGSCDFTIVGDRRRDVPKLAMVRVYLGTALAWEGRVEDHGIAPADDPVTTTVTCFGLQRRLTDVSVRRIWSKRDMPFKVAPPDSLVGAAFTQNLVVSIGTYLSSDLTKIGVGVTGTGVSVGSNEGAGAFVSIPPGLTVIRVMADLVLSGANTGPGKIQAGLRSLEGAAYAYTASGAINEVLGPPSGLGVLLIAYNIGGGLTPTQSDVCQFSNIRILGTSLQEDAAGGFYGSTILNDLLALIPGLTIGIIESGSDYLIPSIDRAIRDTSLSVVNEVAGYCNREWVVWEEGRFDWKTPNLDEPQWIVPLEQMLPGTRMETSVDTLASRVYVLFQEALDGVSAEQTAAAADPRNPLVKGGVGKDELLQAPAVMTDNTSLLLAQAKAATQVYAPVSGTVVLNAGSLIQNAVGSAQPAALIRAGTNVYLPGMPKTDSLIAVPARDGETLFHIVATEVDMDAGTITLELEGQAREIDVIAARLAASTRVITG